MLACSRRLNPERAHTVGDMRSLALGRTFDLVLAHDALDYMTTEHDLRAAFETAWQHLAPGGLACFLPDEVAETFEPGTDVSGGDDDHGRAVRLFEWDGGGEVERDQRAGPLLVPGEVAKRHVGHAHTLFRGQRTAADASRRAIRGRVQS
jgi:SAM-dependent methyltransferase